MKYLPVLAGETIGDDDNGWCQTGLSLTKTEMVADNYFGRHNSFAIRTALNSTPNPPTAPDYGGMRTNG